MKLRLFMEYGAKRRLPSGAKNATASPRSERPLSLPAVKFRVFIASFLACLHFALPAYAKDISIPRAAYSYKSLLLRSGHAFWGLDAPCATFAAQIHAESLWRPEAVSRVGARGMAQFMPATAAWISERYPHLAENAPHSPSWAIRALITYNRFLWERVMAADGCNRMAKCLSAYNGGLGWLKKDEALARKLGLDPNLCFGGTEKANAGRSAAAKKENREYPRRILLELEPLYKAGAFGGGMCE